VILAFNLVAAATAAQQAQEKQKSPLAGFFEQGIVFPQTEQAFYHIPGIVVAKDGCVLAFCEEYWGSGLYTAAECHVVLRRSHDHGVTWDSIQYLRRKPEMSWHMGSAIVDETTGRILLMCGGGWLKSDDSGATWVDWTPTMINAKDGLGAGTHGSGPGITLRYGPHKGRLVWPARSTDNREGYNDSDLDDRRAKCYSTVLYSDDHGQTLHRSNVFLRGTGEAVLVERLDGDLYMNARAYFEDGKRYTAISCDGGATFGDERTAPTIRETPQGCCAGMVRYPPELAGGRDLILFSNPDTIERKRVHGVVRLSLDGGDTWSYSRAVNTEKDWFDYSSLAVAKDGTVLLMYKTSPTLTGSPGHARASSMAVARFDLAWLTNGVANVVGQQARDDAPRPRPL